MRKIKSYRIVNKQGQYLDNKGNWTQNMADAKNFLKK